MSKGNLTKFITGDPRGRLTRITTLFAASAVLVALISLDASASPTLLHHDVYGAGLFQSSRRAGIASTLQGFGRRDSTTTTTTPSTPGLQSSPSGGTPAPTGSTPGLGQGAASDATSTSTGSTTTTTAPPDATTTTVPAPSSASGTASGETGGSPGPYPVGTPDSSEPSGYAPPSPSALPGYTQTYVEDFAGSGLPSAWGSYEGPTAGDPGGYFDQAHVTVSSGMLQFNTWQDPNFSNQWVTGGACLCNLPSQVYGAYFVRSRLTGPGATQVELLMPDANVWPPEIDFNESYGGTSSTSATDHYSSANSTVYKTLGVELTQWHTWGVIWTASAIYYTLDGKVWGSVTSPGAIPDIPMHLSLQQQTWCASNWACPSSPSSLDVDWVAVYSPAS